MAPTSAESPMALFRRLENELYAGKEAQWTPYERLVYVFIRGPSLFDPNRAGEKHVYIDTGSPTDLATFLEALPIVKAIDQERDDHPRTHEGRRGYVTKGHGAALSCTRSICFLGGLAVDGYIADDEAFRHDLSDFLAQHHLHHRWRFERIPEAFWDSFHSPHLSEEGHRLLRLFPNHLATGGMMFQSRNVKRSLEIHLQHLQERAAGP